jgi:mono/diheme cytochrome c family protein
LVALCLLLLSCGAEESVPGTPPQDQTPGPGAGTDAGGDAPAPAEPRPDPEVPPRSFACIDANAGAGERHYVTLCASCHGARGDGQGPSAAGLNPKPALHADGGVMNPLSNEHLFRVIRDGGPAVGKSALMAPWGGALSDSQVWDVVAFVRTLAEPAYRCP